MCSHVIIYTTSDMCSHVIIYTTSDMCSHVITYTTSHTCSHVHHVHYMRTSVPYIPDVQT